MSVVERARGKHLEEGDHYVGDAALFAAALLKAYDALAFYAAQKHWDPLLSNLADPTFSLSDYTKDVIVEDGSRARAVLAELDA